ncbi:MAG: hypothetical protein ABIL09_29910 [Gemmatimonadota bacterium]
MGAPRSLRWRRRCASALMLSAVLVTAGAAPGTAVPRDLAPRQPAANPHGPSLRLALQVGHVPGAMGTYGTGLQVSLRQLSWASLAGGIALGILGYAAADPSYAAMGAMLGPLGAWGLFRTRDTFTYVTGEGLGPEYTVRHYAEDIRYIFDKQPERRDAARGLLMRHPDLHRQFLWSLEAFRDPATETPEDRLFLEWYRGLEER